GWREAVPEEAGACVLPFLVVLPLRVGGRRRWLLLPADGVEDLEAHRRLRLLLRRAGRAQGLGGSTGSGWPGRSTVGRGGGSSTGRG
ncbi:MAG: hypothetical protein D6809_05195, partial [Gammaproteobacteria bacterium]